MTVAPRSTFLWSGSFCRRLGICLVQQVHCSRSPGTGSWDRLCTPCFCPTSCSRELCDPSRTSVMRSLPSSPQGKGEGTRLHRGGATELGLGGRGEGVWQVRGETGFPVEEAEAPKGQGFEEGGQVEARAPPSACGCFALFPWRAVWKAVAGKAREQDPECPG